MNEVVEQMDLSALGRLIPLKTKYRWQPYSRWPAVGDHNLKKVRRNWTTGPKVKYVPRDHVLYLKPSGGTVMLHYADAQRVLGE